MILKKKLLAKSRLYAIVDRQTSCKANIPKQTKQLRDAGVHIIQLRDKVCAKSAVLETARALKKILSGYPVLFIINDHIDICALIDSDGVHLGQKDTSLVTCRKILGDNKLIGISCCTLTQAIKAQAQGADYLGIGPVYATKTKKDAGRLLGINCISKIKEKIHIPFFVIGGIGTHNMLNLKKQGARRFALCAALCKGKNIRATTQSFLNL